MKYNIQINQKAIIDLRLNLTLEEAIILDFCMQFVNSPQAVKIYYNNSMYVWISHNLILENLPILKLKKDSIYRKMKELCEKQFLLIHPETQKLGRSYYSIGINANKLIFSPSEENPNPRINTHSPTDKNPNPYGNKSEAPSEENPNYNNINYNTINNNYIIDNKESVSVSESEIESVKYYFETNQILELLTEKTGAKYKIPKTKSLLLRYGVYKLIKERFEDGAILEDFVNIIEYKYNEWINTKFISYLVPDTLFRKSNFEKYLTQIQIKPISNNTNNLIDDNGNYAKTDEGRKLFHANVAKGAADAIRAIRNGERDDFWLRISNAKPE